MKRIALFSLAMISIATVSIPAASAGTPANAPTNGTGTASIQSTIRSTESPGYTIVCDVSVDDPHNSSHVPGTVNVVASVSCPGPIENITLQAHLLQPPPGSTINGRTVYGIQNISANAANTSCINGTYQGHATGSLTFPPGYSPHTESINVYGISKAITCSF